MFLRSRNPLLTFLLSHLVWVTSKIWVNFRFESSGVASPKKLGVLTIFPCWWAVKVTLYMHGTTPPPPPLYIKHFSMDLCKSQEGSSEQKWGIQTHPFPVETPLFESYPEVLMIASYGFSQYLQYSCFQGQGIICWHFYWAIMFGGLRKIQNNFRF